MTNIYIDTTTGLLVGAEYRPSPNYNERPQNAVIDTIVIHNASLPKGHFGGEAITDLFCNRLDLTSHPTFAYLAGVKVSAHLLIRRDGKIVQYVPFTKRAWHAGVSQLNGRENFNDFSIGIELEGTDDIKYEEIQYQQLGLVTFLLMQVYPKITPENLVAHSTIAPTRKTDPGPAFLWEKYRSMLQE